MKLAEIRAMPKVIEIEGQRYHESVLRSHNILNKVIELLSYETPHQVVMEIIDDLRAGNV